MVSLGKIVEGVVVVRIGRVEHKVAGLIQLRLDEWVMVIRLYRQVATKLRLGIILEQGEIPLLFIIDHQRLVIRHQLTRQREHIQ